MKNGKAKKNIRVNIVLDALNLNAAELSRGSGVDRTLISRWQSGERKLTRRSRQLLPVALALLRLDKNGALEEILAPYRQRGESEAAALCEYLTGDELPALAARAKAPVRQGSGEYVKEVRVFLGQKGFRRAAIAMLDYVMTLPPRPGGGGALSGPLRVDRGQFALCAAIHRAAGKGHRPRQPPAGGKPQGVQRR